MRRCSAERSDEVHVVDAGFGRHVEHGFDDPLTDVGPPHRRQRQRDVVERDRELHAGEQQFGQGLRVAERVEERMADGGVGSSGLERLGRIDDSRAVRGDFSSRNPSPCHMSNGGVDRSTSRTNPGLGMAPAPLLVARSKRDLHCTGRRRWRHGRSPRDSERGDRSRDRAARAGVGTSSTASVKSSACMRSSPERGSRGATAR